MELRHLRYFVAVAQTLNFRKAAERLHISQPPLSLQIKQLEEELGVQLFERTNKSVSLTQAGQVFLKRAHIILEQAKHSIEEAQMAAQGQVGRLRVGFVGSAVTGVLQDAVREFRMHCPNVALALKQTTNREGVEGLEAEHFDLLIGRMPLSTPDTVTAHIIYEDDYCLSVSSDHALAKRKTVSIEDIKDEPLIMFERHIAPVRYDQVLSIYTQRGLSPNIVQEALEQMTIMGLVASGIGLSIVPKSMKAISMPGISYVDLECVEQKTALALLSRDESNVLVDNFVDLMKR
ncbi:MAG: LysR substrate-binding domain-containing protein [Pseudomonadota bacterium]